MTTFVDIEPGQWVLAWRPEYFFPGEEMAGWAERLQYRGAGWDHMLYASRFEILLVTNVKPKTFFAVGKADGTEDGSVRRAHREVVLAAGKSQSEMQVLEAKLMDIGNIADGAIEEEAVRLVAPFAKATRAAAVAQIHALLPHLFERVSA